jgi:hypothetical protein
MFVFEFFFFYLLFLDVFTAIRPITLDVLAKFFKSTPRLNRLELKFNGIPVDADAWQSTLESSLPLLTHFSIQAMYPV